RSAEAAAVAPAVTAAVPGAVTGAGTVAGAVAAAEGALEDARLAQLGPRGRPGQRAGVVGARPLALRHLRRELLGHLPALLAAELPVRSLACRRTRPGPPSRRKPQRRSPARRRPGWSPAATWAARPGSSPPPTPWSPSTRRTAARPPRCPASWPTCRSPSWSS